MQRLVSALQSAIDYLSLKRVVLSRPFEKDILRSDARPVMLKGGLHIQLATYHKDGKVYHRNIPAAQATEEILALFEKGYRQMNLLTSSGQMQAKRGKDAKTSVTGSLGKGQSVAVASHDEKRDYILEEKPTPFLVKLGLMDQNGRVFDRKRAKFRQINRFLEYVRDVMDKLDEEQTLCVYDLCCGKAYLTFALYHYLTQILGRSCQVYGVDRKADVIAWCQKTAQELNYSGLHFFCADIEEVRPQKAVDLVVALHACDTATDIALAHAVKWGAKAILSAPCCQHELAGQIKPDAMGMLLKQPLLRYRFAQLATDALRVQLLQACDYSVQATEFVNPDETDKNLLIRAVRLKRPLTEKRKQEILDDYLRTTSLLGVHPTLAVLLSDRISI